MKTQQGRTLAHQAAYEEDIGALIGILENKFELINELDNDKNSPLSLSIITEKYFSSRTLITNGADVNKGGGFYGSCLNIATMKL